MKEAAARAERVTQASARQFERRTKVMKTHRSKRMRDVEWLCTLALLVLCSAASSSFGQDKGGDENEISLSEVPKAVGDVIPCELDDATIADIARDKGYESRV